MGQVLSALKKEGEHALHCTCVFKRHLCVLRGAASAPALPSPLRLGAPCGVTSV